MRLIPLALLLTLALAAPAAAAPSFSIGKGQDPDLAIDDAGTARIAWIEEDAAPGVLRIRVCRLPRGAPACDFVQTLEPPETDVRALQLLAAGTTVHVVVASSAGWFVSTSTTDGPFSAWKPAGDEDFRDGTAFLGPTGTNRISIANPSSFQSWLVGAGKTTVEKDFTTTFPTPTYSGAGNDPDSNRPVVVSADGDHAEYFSYTGPVPATTGALANNANWSAAAPVGTFGDVPRMASGKSGLFMLMNTEVGAGFANQVQVRRWTGSGFGPAVDVGPRERAYEYDLFVHGATGHLLAAWRFNDSPSARLVVSRSIDGGATWSAATITKGNNELNQISAIEVAAAPDDQGLAVFEDAGISGSNDHDIRAATLDPLPEPVTPTNPGGTGGPKPQQPQQPQQPQPPVTPEDPPASNSFGTVKVGDFRFELFAPSACVPASANVRLKVGYKEKRKVVRGKKRRSRYRLSKAVFSVVGLKKTDKKKPLRVKFPAAPFLRGQDIPVKVKVTLKRRKGVKGGKKTLKKTLKGSFRIC